MTGARARRTFLAAALGASFLHAADSADIRSLPADQETLRVLVEAEKNSPFNTEVLRQIAKAYQTEILCMIAKQYWELAAEAGRVGDTKLRKHLTDCSLGYGEKAVRSNPDSPLAHAVLAICYAHSAELEGPGKKIAYSRLVRSEGEKALEIDPRQDIALHVLGAWNYTMSTIPPLLKRIAETVYGRLPDSSLKAAADYFRRAAQSDPSKPMHLAGLAKTYAAMGEREKAVRTLKAAEVMPATSKEDDKLIGEARSVVLGAPGPKAGLSGQEAVSR